MIDRLSLYKNQIAALDPPLQKFSFARFNRIYQRLFQGSPAWNRLHPYISQPNWVSRADLATMSVAAKNGTLGWDSLFIATMIWGYGNSDKGGPTKLFLALETPDATNIIADAAALVLQASLPGALVCIRRLDETGISFGTKFLYAAGMASSVRPKPLVLDRKVITALQHGLGEAIANEQFGLNAAYHSHEAGIERASNGYASYCAALDDWANRLGSGITAEKLELFFFEKADSF
jgi:hypothetical protein